MSKQALIVIDIQNDYFENGALPLVNPVKASMNVSKILEHFRAKNLPIAHIQHVSPNGAPFMALGTNGVEIHENVKPLNGEKVFQKSCFYQAAGSLSFGLLPLEALFLFFFSSSFASCSGLMGSATLKCPITYSAHQGHAVFSADLQERYSRHVL